MFSKIMCSVRKASLSVCVGFGALAILLVASPGFAAGPSSIGNNPTGVQAAAGGALGDTSQPDAVCPSNGQCFTDVTSGNPFYAFVNRIYQQNLVTGYPCGGAGEPCDSQQRPYYRPLNNVTRQQMAKFIDNARHLSQIDIEQASGNTPIIARNGTGTAMEALSTSGQAFIAQSTTQLAIYAQSGNSTVISAYSTGGANSVGVYGIANIGIEGSGNGGASSYGVLGTNSGNSAGPAVKGMNNDGGTGVSGVSGTGIGVSGSSGGSSDGVYGSSASGNGVYGRSTTGYGVSGNSTSSYGVYGHTSLDNGYGVYGVSDHGAGVDGENTNQNGFGVRGVSDTVNGTGVYGEGPIGTDGYSDDGYAVHGESPSGYAGYFDGTVHVNGTCCQAGAATTQIDDPLDPTNKVLNESLVQSPDMTTVINGNVMLDSAGQATVTVPAWFATTNGDFRYSLTAVGTPGPDLYIAQELSGSHFTIAGGKAGGKVSWQVTGVRTDPYAQAHPIQPEQDKSADQQGKYLYPTEYGQPASSGVDYSHEHQASGK